MKEYNQKNTIYDYYINNRKKIDYIEEEKVNKKFDILAKKVLSKHEPLTNEKRRQLKEKRLNSIFNKNDYYYIKNEMIQNNDSLQIKNNSFLLNEKPNNKFLKKYKELYGLTKYIENPYFNNKNYNNAKIKNKISYYLNILKRDNINNFPKHFKLNSIINQKIRNLSQGKQGLKRKYINFSDEYFGNISNEMANNNIFNLSNRNSKININKNFLNILKNIDNLIQINSTDNYINTTKNKIQANNFEAFLNNANSMKVYSPKKDIFLNKIDKINNNNYYKENRPKSSSKIYIKKCYNNINLYDSNINKSYNNINGPKNVNKFNNFFFNQNKERIDNKIKNFNAKINLLSLK